MEIILMAGPGVGHHEIQVLIGRQGLLKATHPKVTVALQLCADEVMADRVDQDPQPGQIRLGLISGSELRTTGRHSLVALLRNHPPLGFIVHHQIWRNQELRRMLMLLVSGGMPTKGGTHLIRLT